MSQTADAQGSPGKPLLVRPTAARAVGMLMAATPCSVRDAERILATAADLANVNVMDVAAAMTAGPGAAPVPVRLERALRQAVRAARTPVRAKTARTAVLPSRTRAEEVLSRLRGCQARLAATPADPGALRAMDDAAYTLCVLMDRRTAYDAVLAAEELLATPA
ncbi:DUF5133 domain-containing protein [Streptomyces sp. NPDC060048]|uniref:DUF5133 domain-containing protein n=1 Tax=unclassified Streptomyces TaxID=2593676 RepID=UPI0036C84129